MNSAYIMSQTHLINLRAKAAGAEDKGVQDVKRTKYYRKEVKEVWDIKGLHTKSRRVPNMEIKQSGQKQSYLRKTAFETEHWRWGILVPYRITSAPGWAAINGWV